MGKSEVRKICGFYVNEWHLTTMILPYVHKEIGKENTIITILQNGISKNIEEILSKMNFNRKQFYERLELFQNMGYNRKIEKRRYLYVKI